MGQQRGKRRYRVRSENQPEMRPFLSVGGNDTQTFFRENLAASAARKGSKTGGDRFPCDYVLTEVGRPRDIQREARRQERPLRSLHPVIPSPQPR